MADAQRIERLEAELAGLRAEMQDFSYTVSHDLRASLRHILSYAQLVQEDAGPLLPPEAQGFLHTISDSAKHMGLLMDGLMELSRLGTVALQTAALPLQPVLQDLVTELQMQHPQRVIEWRLPADMPVVLADAQLLRAALHAVLDNAVKFTAQRPVACIALRAWIDPADGLVHIELQDNGAGFNPALQAKLFRPFQRLHTTRQFPGLGMGLALTRKMLERMGGKVWADAAMDAGCRLHMVLPVAPD